MELVVEQLVQPDILALALEDDYSSLELMLRDTTSMTDEKMVDFRKLIWADTKQQQRPPLDNCIHQPLQFLVTVNNLDTAETPVADRNPNNLESSLLRLI